MDCRNCVGFPNILEDSLGEETTKKKQQKERHRNPEKTKKVPRIEIFSQAHSPVLREGTGDSGRGFRCQEKTKNSGKEQNSYQSEIQGGGMGDAKRTGGTSKKRRTEKRVRETNANDLTTCNT